MYTHRHTDTHHTCIHKHSVPMINLMVMAMLQLLRLLISPA